MDKETEAQLSQGTRLAGQEEHPDWTPGLLLFFLQVIASSFNFFQFICMFLLQRLMREWSKIFKHQNMGCIFLPSLFLSPPYLLCHQYPRYYISTPNSSISPNPFSSMWSLFQWLVALTLVVFTWGFRDV